MSRILILALGLVASAAWPQEVEFRHTVDDWTGDETWAVQAKYGSSTGFDTFEVVYGAGNYDGKFTDMLTLSVSGQWDRGELEYKIGDERPRSIELLAFEHQFRGSQGVTFFAFDVDRRLRSALTLPTDTLQIRLGVLQTGSWDYEVVQLTNEFHSRAREALNRAR